MASSSFEEANFLLLTLSLLHDSALEPRVLSRQTVKPFVALAGGLRRVRSLAEFPDESLGFVMACQVFEHVGSPFDILLGLVRKMRPGGSFYCEVPDEADFRDYSLSASSQARWLTWVARRPRLVQAADFVSLACRRGLGVIPPFGFVKMHEHLSFFTLKSLEALFSRSGLEVQLLRRTRTTAPILQLCARRPEEGIPCVKRGHS